MKEPRNKMVKSTVSNIFNNYFSTVAMEIGNESPLSEEESLDEIFHIYEDHKSVKNIYIAINSKIFHLTSMKYLISKVRYLIQELDHRKACGSDDMPPTLLKSAANEFAPAVTTLVNKPVSMSHFRCELKNSELSPLFKDKDYLITQNYRPLSVLTSLSIFFEKVYNEQLNDHFKNVLSVLLSAIRKHYGCEHVLTKLIEDCKHALDENQNVGLILLDLSKAFDCLPHRLLLCKLRSYGVSYESCKLIKSYLCNRLQRVKVASTRSEWAVMPKGVPHDSGFGPLLFSIFSTTYFIISRMYTPFPTMQTITQSAVTRTIWISLKSSSKLMPRSTGLLKTKWKQTPRNSKLLFSNTVVTKQFVNWIYQMIQQNLYHVSNY